MSEYRTPIAAPSFWLGGARTVEVAEKVRQRLQERYPNYRFTLGVSTGKQEYWRHYVSANAQPTEEMLEFLNDVWDQELRRKIGER